ncbi:hypothetical protein O4G98_18995 [Zoogloeaceae bacterium G21618-S1]|nr:hypothetical protein [Zoogloeaceae bacterium G21618-S1]
MTLFRRKSETRDLSNDAFVLATEKQQRRNWTPLLLIILICSVAYAGLQHFEAQLVPAADRVAELERENAALRDALELQRMNLSVEQATRAELEKELSARSAELNRLGDELALFKNAQKKP